MATIQIYGVPSSPFTRATRLAAREKGVDYELEPTRPGETAPLNPLGKMPMMKHGDFTPYDRRRRRPISSWCRSFSIFPKLRS